MTCQEFQALFKKLFQSIIPDLLSFTLGHKIYVLIFCSINICFSIVDLNHFYDPVSYPFVLQWKNNESKGVEQWKLYFILLSGIASFSGIICVQLIMLRKFSNFFWGIINSLTYGAFAIAYSYGGDIQIKFFIVLPFQFIGMIQWDKSIRSEADIHIRSFSLGQFVIVFMAWIGCASALYYEIPLFTKAIGGEYPYLTYEVPRILDAISTASSIIGQVLLVFEFLEQWMFWLIVDTLQIVIYAGIAHFGLNINIIIMWTIFWINAVCGGTMWYRRYRSQSN